VLVESSIRSGGTSERAALVTGAYGEIGQRIVWRLAESGYLPILVDHPDAKRNNLNAIRDVLDAGAVSIFTDLSSPGGVESVTNRIETEFRSLSCIVHCASPPIHPTPACLTEEEGMDRQISVAALCLAGLCRSLVPLMQRQQRGVIVGMLSTVLETPRPKCWWNYTVGKFALHGVLTGLSTDVEGSGVRVVSVMPGAVRSRLSRDAGVSQQQTMEPDSVAKLVVGIVGDERRFRNGDVVRVDGDKVEIGGFEFVCRRGAE